MEHKVNDLVMVRNEINTNEYYDGICFSKSMGRFKGRTFKVSDLLLGGHYELEETGQIDSDVMDFRFSSEMLFPAFKTGDSIEVSNIPGRWDEGTRPFICNLPTGNFLCAYTGREEQLDHASNIDCFAWKYARLIQEKEIIIDGKTIKLSLSSFEELKKSLLE